MMQAARAGARLLRPACNLGRAGGILAQDAVPPAARVFSVAAYASPSTFLEKAEVMDRVTGLLRSSPLIDPAKVTPTANFEKDLQLDMLDSVEVMMTVEEEFAIDIPNSEADKISTVAQLIDYIASHPQAK